MTGAWPLHGLLLPEYKIWIVTDGDYAGRPVSKPLTDLGVVVFRRLRKDGCLFDLPPAPVTIEPVQFAGSGNIVFAEILSENVTELATGWRVPCRPDSAATRLEYSTSSLPSRNENSMLFGKT